MSIKTHEGGRCSAEMLSARLPTLAAALRPVLHSAVASTTADLVAEARYAAQRSAVLGTPADFGAYADLTGPASLAGAPPWQAAKWFLASEAHRLSKPGVARSPGTDLGLTVTSWPDPTAPGQVLVLVRCERLPLFEAARAHLGLDDWGHWNNTDPDPEVPRSEWEVRRASWTAALHHLGDVWALPAFAEVGSFDVSVVVTAVTVLLDRHATLLGLSGDEDAVSVLLDPLDAPVDEAQAARIRARQSETDKMAARIGPVVREGGGVDWAGVALMTQATSLIERDLEWTHLFEPAGLRP